MLLDSQMSHIANNQQPYAIAKLEEAARVVKQSISELPAIRKRLEKFSDNKPKAREIYNDLQQQYNRLLGALNLSALSLLEMELPDEADYAVRLSRSIKSFNLMTPDYGKLCGTLSGYLGKLSVLTQPIPNESALNQDISSQTASSQPKSQTTNASIIGRLMNNVKMGYYPTDTEHVKHIARGIEFPEGVAVNLFDPCCGCGMALKVLADGGAGRDMGTEIGTDGNGDRNIDRSAASTTTLTYGIELDSHRAEEALTRLNRVGFGSYFRSRISHESFHAMLLNPPYLSVMTEGGNNTRSEKRFLVDSICHLMYGGLLVYIIPYYRLSADICRILCDNFDGLTVWKFTGSEFKRYKQVAVMGTRRKRQDGSDMVSELMSLVIEPDKMRELTDLPENYYQLPAVTKKVQLFKGAEFNVTELAEQLNKSASFSRLFEKSKLDSTSKRPLLPLNLGQVGLIGGSGLINGLVECSTPHIIKGRIVKENKVTAEETLNNRGDVTSTTVYETRVNKMIFNVLTPQGFLSLV